MFNPRASEPFCGSLSENAAIFFPFDKSVAQFLSGRAGVSPRPTAVKSLEKNSRSDSVLRLTMAPNPGS